MQLEWFTNPFVHFTGLAWLYSGQHHDLNRQSRRLSKIEAAWMKGAKHLDSAGRKLLTLSRMAWSLEERPEQIGRVYDAADELVYGNT